MKKFAFTSLLLGALLGGFASTAQADDCCYAPPTYCYDDSFCNGKFTVSADWLYWKVQEEAIYFTSLNTNTATSSVPNSTFVDALLPDFKYQNGFRVGIEYELPGDEWQFGVVYTYIPGHGAIHRHAENTLQTFADTTGTASSLHAKWNLNLSYLDVDLARSIACGECFSLRPHIGFRAAWIDQKYHSTALLTSSTSTSSNYGYFKINEHFNGYGIEGGLWGEWKFGWNLSLVGHIGGSILYSEFKTSAPIYQINVAADGTETTPVDHPLHYNRTTGTPTIDYFVGLQYASNFCDFDVSAHIGWEQHIFFNMLDANEQGNLSAQGLTLGLDVGF